MKWPWQRKKHTGVDAVKQQAERELREVRQQSSEVRQLADTLRRHLADNQFAERLYLQMIQTRR